MDLIANQCKEIDAFPADAKDEQKPEWLVKIATADVAAITPYSVTSVPWVKDQFAGSVKASVDEFVKDFADSSMRRDLGRGMRQNDNKGVITDANDFLLNKFVGLHPPGSFLAPSLTGTSEGDMALKSHMHLYN